MSDTVRKNVRPRVAVGATRPSDGGPENGAASILDAGTSTGTGMGDGNGSGGGTSDGNGTGGTSTSNGSGSGSGAVRLAGGEPGPGAGTPAEDMERATESALRLAVRAAAEVVELVRNSPVRRIQVTVGDVRIEVEGAEPAQSREALLTVSADPGGAAGSGTAAVAAVPGAAVAAVAGAVPAVPVDTVPVTAPLMGVFYRSPGPDHPPFVEPGQRVEAGDQVAIVEAMKMMNPVVTDRSGIVRAVQAIDGDVVEYDQPLLLIEPC